MRILFGAFKWYKRFDGEKTMSIILPSNSGKYGRNITADYNTINDLELTTEKRAKLEMWIAKNVGEDLIKLYPNREWGVRVDIEGQVLVISCDSVSSEKGYFIHMAKRNIHDLQLEARKAAGEILERHGVSRKRLIDEDVFETMNRDARDSVVTEDSLADGFR